MKLGLDSYSYHYAAGLWEYLPKENPPMTALHFMRKTSELGLDGLHICDPRHLESLDYGYIAGLREKAESLGIYLELGTEGVNPDHLQNMVRAAHVLGSSLIRTFVGRPRSKASQGMNELLAAAAADIVGVIPVCERYGIGLAIENHQDLTARELLQLLEIVASPWVGVCFNTAHPLALLEDPVEAAELLSPMVKSVHLTDCRMVAARDGFVLHGCALGEGIVDLTRILDIVGSRAPEANLNVEAAVGKKLVPVFSDDYAAALPKASARDLARVIRILRDRTYTASVLPTDGGASEDDILAHEDDLVLSSVQWAQRALGRPETELADR